MFGALKKRGWRGAVGLITAYAFVLQAFLAYSVASQAAVHGNSSGAFFVICTNDDTGTGWMLQPRLSSRRHTARSAH